MNRSLAFWSAAHIARTSVLNLWTFGFWGIIAALPVTFMLSCLWDAAKRA